MKRAVVIAIDEERSVFALKAPDGRCAVFCQSGGVRVRLGDVVNGEVLGRGSRALRHRDGTCWAVGDTGPIAQEAALKIVLGASRTQEADLSQGAAPAGSANDGLFRAVS